MLAFTYSPPPPPPPPAWDAFGYRLGGYSLIARVVDDVLRPQPQASQQASP